MSPILDYASYRRRLLDLAADLEELGGHAEALGLHQRRRQLDRSLERIRTDTLRVAVVGEFKRGKSTLINALLGRPVLPADVLPCSATLNRITHGLEPRVEIRYRDGRRETLEPEALAATVTKLTPESEAIAATVEEATVYVDLPLCAHHVDLVDTPGLNDDQAMTRITEEVLPTVDAAILVIAATSPFSESERDFLGTRLLGRELGRLIFVLNGIDRLGDPADADRVAREVERRLAELIGDRAEPPRVFPLSSHQALRARLAGDPERLEASRFPAFEEALEETLVKGRAQTLLRAAEQGRMAAAREILEAATARARALELDDDALGRAFDRANLEIEGWRRRGAEQHAGLETAAEALLDRLRPRILQLPDRLDGAITRTVAQAPISAADFRRRDLLAERLHRVIASAVRAEALAELEALQAEIEAEALRRLEELESFSRDLGEGRRQVLRGFAGDADAGDADAGDADAGGSELGGGAESALDPEVADRLGQVFDTLARRWADTLRDDTAGTVVGTLGGMGGLVLGNALISALGLPAAWPVALALGLGSVLGGRYLGRLALGHVRALEWRQLYEIEARRALRRQLGELDLEGQLARQVEVVFGALGERLDSEIDAGILDLRTLLGEIRSHRHSRQAQQQEQRRQLHALAERVGRMLEPSAAE